MKFQRIGLFSRHEKPDVLKVLQTIITYLNEHNLEIVLETDTAQFLEMSDLPVVSAATFGKNCDIVISVGGDGNFLNAARMVVENDTPLVGVNCGKLGFLTDIKPREVTQKLDDILNGHYYEEKRFLLEAYQETVRDSSAALNEVTLVTETTARMIRFEITIDDQFLCSQHSNGMIIATPTGSTAYALSAGGPILHTNLEAIVMVPLLPHTLSNRPIVIESSSKIKLTLSKTSKAAADIYCDNQHHTQLNLNETISIQKMKTPVRLLHPLDYDYFETLRSKLHWGEK